jgi:hypothetical protein
VEEPEEAVRLLALGIVLEGFLGLALGSADLAAGEEIARQIEAVLGPPDIPIGARGEPPMTSSVRAASVIELSSEYETLPTKGRSM